MNFSRCAVLLAGLAGVAPGVAGDAVRAAAHKASATRVGCAAEPPASAPRRSSKLRHVPSESDPCGGSMGPAPPASAASR